TRIAEDMPAIFCEPRGRGMMLGLPVAEPYEAAHIVDVARELHHLLINAAGDNTIRIVPPLVLGPVQARDGLKRLRSAAASAA
ncbi:MAG TPA: hypothetical protein VKG44_00310, partial [Candidatus Baltobacteraceae bacterium]|nr:hypothetical protein [Candidatus Baltobacteraceae bacterium]